MSDPIVSWTPEREAEALKRCERPAMTELEEYLFSAIAEIKRLRRELLQILGDAIVEAIDD